MCMLLLVIDKNMYHTFGHVHYDIFSLKQNILLIIKVSFSFIT